MANSLRAAQIEDSIADVSGSPNVARHVKRDVHSAGHSDNTRGSMIALFVSPSKAGASANSSPTSSRYKDLMESPSWRRDEKKFVRDTRSQGDDPFVSDGSPSKAPGQGMCLLHIYSVCLLKSIQ